MTATIVMLSEKRKERNSSYSDLIPRNMLTFKLCGQRIPKELCDPFGRPITERQALKMFQARITKGIARSEVINPIQLKEFNLQDVSWRLARILKQFFFDDRYYINCGTTLIGPKEGELRPTMENLCRGAEAAFLFHSIIAREESWNKAHEAYFYKKGIALLGEAHKVATNMRIGTVEWKIFYKWMSEYFLEFSNIAWKSVVSLRQRKQ